MEINNAISQSIKLIEDEIGRLTKVLDLLKGEVSREASPSGPIRSKEPEVKTSFELDNEQLRFEFLWFVKDRQRFVHLNEVADYIINSAGYPEDESKELTSRLGTALLPLKKDKTIVKYQPGKSLLYSYWGSPNWLSGGKLASDAFGPNTAYPKVKRKEKVLI